METLIVMGIIGLLGYTIYKAGKREGSRKGFGVGRSRGRWRR